MARIKPWLLVITFMSIVLIIFSAVWTYWVATGIHESVSDKKSNTYFTPPRQLTSISSLSSSSSCEHGDMVGNISIPLNWRSFQVPISWTEYREAYDKCLRMDKEKFKNLPNFIIVGVTKGGTTFLYSTLKQHPKIKPSKKKEVRFFDTDSNFEQGLKWYKTQFPSLEVDSDLITGEATPNYFSHPQVIARMIKTLPNFCHVKLIVLLRDPVSRVWSYYHMKRYEHTIRKGENLVEGVNGGFLGKFDDPPKTFHQALSENKDGHYFSKGIYIDHLKLWTEYFRPNQLFITQSEEMFGNVEEFMKKVHKFLNIPDYKYNK